MKFVSGSKHAAVQTRCNSLIRQLEEAEKRDTERLAVIGRLRNELDQQRDRKPDGPVQQPKPAVGDAELLRQLNLAQRTIRVQAEQLEQLQTSHIADTRELHDLRQGVTL